MKPKASTTVGRLIKAAENAKQRAEQEGEKERTKAGLYSLTPGVVQVEFP